MKRFEVIAEKILDSKLNVSIGAEIGLWRGQTFFYLLNRFPGLYMIGVDQWKVYSGFGDKAATGFTDYSLKEKDMKKNKAFVLKELKRYGSRRTALLEMSSLSAAEFIKDQTLDFVFIDGDHRASFVRADIAAWAPRVKKEGLIFGHDWNIPSVKKALSDYAGKVKLIDHDHVWMMVKP